MSRRPNVSPISPSLILFLSAGLLATLPAWSEEPATAPAAEETLAVLIADVVAWREEENPLPVPEGTDPRYEERMWSVSAEDVADRAARLADFATRLEAIDRDTLSPEEKLDAAVLDVQLTSRRGELRFRTYLIPITNREGFHISFARRPDDAVLRSVEDYDGYVAKLQSFATYTDQQIAHMREGMRQGMVLPQVVLHGYEGTISAHIVDDPAASRFYDPLRTLPTSLPEADRERLQRDGLAAVRESVIPAYRSFLAFMVDEYLPAARTSIAASDLPDGPAFYQHRVRRFTTLDVTAEEVHRIGEAEVARLRGEMAAVIEEVGFEGSFRAFLDFLRTDPRFYVDEPEDYLKAAAVISKRMDGELPRLFKNLPKTPYGIVPIPDFLAPKTTGAYYSGGEADGSRAGNYFLNVSKLSSRPLYILEALSFHEAVPGHHLQGMLNAENEAISPLRRNAGLSAFGEGWALYAERLGLEVGFYTDPYSNFGRLTYEIWRACRLVVDTGIHAFGWSRQQARDYMAANTALSLHEIETEVDRYIAWPGQALAYKMGELEITALRKRAEEALGPRFDVRDFHDAVLANGPLPLKVLGEQIDAYIEETATRPHPDLARLIAEVKAFREEEEPLPLPSGTDPRYRNRMPAISEASLTARAATLDRYLERLTALDTANDTALNATDRIDAAVLALQLRNERDHIRTGAPYMALSSREGFHISFVQDLESRSFRTVEDYDRYIARLQSFSAYAEGQIGLLRRGMEKGLVLPRVVLAGYEETIAAHIVETVSDSTFYRPLATIPAAFSEADRTRILEDGTAAIRDAVLPALAAFHAFMVDEYLPATRTTLAATALPGGDDYYAYRVRRYTSLNSNPEDIHRTGHAEVARLRAEMEAVIAETGFEGSFQDFLAHLRSEPRFYAESEDEYLAAAAYAAKRMDGLLPQLFSELPRNPYGLRPIPAFIAPRASSGYYDHGEADGSKAGAMNLNTSELASRPLYLVEALVFHEGVPGHHLQLMLQRESENVPDFRKGYGIGAYVEGWALYAERLGLEVGFYTDPYSNFGRLTYEIWRACRLVVDTGIHAFGWSRQQAIDFMAANTALSTYEVATEVDRYISEPGQALGYKIGELAITALRQRAEETLGPRFDLRDFHHAVLRNGAIPLDVLEEQIEGYIEATLAADVEDVEDA